LKPIDAEAGFADERIDLPVEVATPGNRAPDRVDGRATQDRHAVGDETPICICCAPAAPGRYLPRDSFPPRSTVYNIFRKFQRDGVWEADLGRVAYGGARAVGPRGQPVGCGSRQRVGQIGRKRGW
jgi:hypothetical protein